jgi:membrane-associated phospholipid phosphatase
MKTSSFIVRLIVMLAIAGVLGVPSLTAQLVPPPADADAGTWQMIALSSPAQITVAAPGNVAGADYQAELTSIRNAQARLTKAQRDSIKYWSRGGVLAWNEIMLGLVSRANLPPAPAPDGTYPVPDANNPFADPQFPFGNPPYAARAYSYVAVAQFEALKVAWHYKFLYNRPGPSQVDPRIQSLMPSTGVPSYPSEDAVVSGVTAELLKLLFPTAVDQITLKAGEQRQAALLSGRASSSDIAAGLALGQAVAAVFVARAGSDGMRTAGGSPALFQALAAAAVARGEVPWQSLETPPRPPMLAAFRAVRAWMMTPDDVVRERPGPPPSTSSALMARELAEVKAAVAGLSRPQLAIVYKWADGVSTPTPPGHWNYIAWPYVTQARLSEVRIARVFALLNMAMHDAAVVTWDTKFEYFNPRPSQLDPSIRTVIGLPNFPAYISGHSTFSAAASEVLSYLFPSGSTFFQEQRDEASLSRLYGGIHYRADIEVGRATGQQVGGYTVRFARLDGADN